MKEKNSLKNKILLILCILFLLIFLLISFLVKNNLFLLDISIWEKINNIRNSALTDIFTKITHLGDKIFLVIIVTLTSLILIVKKRYKESIFLISSSIIGAYILNRLIKYLFTRPRPFTLDLVKPLVSINGYSYPSGHAMGSIIVYIILVYILFNKKIKKLGIIFAIILATAISCTRVYLGVHYPSDIFAGFFLGLSFDIMAILIYRRFYGNKKSKSKRLKSYLCHFR